ncbi:hypothetical protein L596_019510 [Steinernema carpocapsae]|uniref:Uncharacterized protein n=1 Tax=Steinernema carpocapsae TaxID=34508 RepID=A0A4U5MRK0_STECR|nr:hypothetical protein L596_019510 [Steinernema carpocapsae]
MSSARRSFRFSNEAKIWSRWSIFLLVSCILLTLLLGAFIISFTPWAYSKGWKFLRRFKRKPRFKQVTMVVKPLRDRAWKTAGVFTARRRFPRLYPLMLGFRKDPRKPHHKPRMEGIQKGCEIAIRNRNEEDRSHRIKKEVDIMPYYSRFLQ